MQKASLDDGNDATDLSTVGKVLRSAGLSTDLLEDGEAISVVVSSPNTRKTLLFGKAQTFTSRVLVRPRVDKQADEPASPERPGTPPSCKAAETLNQKELSSVFDEKLRRLNFLLGITEDSGSHPTQSPLTLFQKTSTFGSGARGGLPGFPSARSISSRNGNSGEDVWDRSDRSKNLEKNAEKSLCEKSVAQTPGKGGTCGKSSNSLLIPVWEPPATPKITSLHSLSLNESNRLGVPGNHRISADFPSPEEDAAAGHSKTRREIALRRHVSFPSPYERMPSVLEVDCEEESREETLKHSHSKSEEVKFVAKEEEPSLFDSQYSMPHPPSVALFSEASYRASEANSKLSKASKASRASQSRPNRGRERGKIRLSRFSFAELKARYLYEKGGQRITEEGIEEGIGPGLCCVVFCATIFAAIFLIGKFA